MAKKKITKGYLKATQLLSIVLLVIFNCCKGYAQNPEFYVFKVNGNASISGQNGKEHPVKAKTFLSPGDILLVKPASMVILYSEDGKEINANQTGRYIVGSLAQRFAPVSLDLSAKFFALVWQGFYHPESLKSESPQGETWGAGNRGVGDCDIELKPVSGQQCYRSSLTFLWNSNASHHYQLFIYDNNGDTLLNTIRSDTSFSIRRDTLLAIGDSDHFYYAVSDDTKPCQPYPKVPFIILTDSVANLQVNTMVSKFHQTNNHFLSLLKLSDLLLQKGYIDDAHKYYIEALTLPTD